MAVYTTEVRTICKQFYLNSIGWTQGQPEPVFPERNFIIRKVARDVIPLTLPQDSPFSPASVCEAILTHYWMREIGMETVALWQYGISTRLQEIMPKYMEMARMQAEMGTIWETENRTLKHSGEFDNVRNENGTDSRDRSGTQGNVRDTSMTESGDYSKKADRTVDVTDSRDTTSEESGTNKSDTTVSAKDVTGGHHESTTATNQTVTNDLNETVKDTQSGTSDGTAKVTGTKTNLETNHDKYSDTPQNGIVDVEQGKYLTSYRAVDNDVIENTTQDTATTGATEGTQDIVKDNTGTVKTETDVRDGGSKDETTTSTGTTGVVGSDSKTGTQNETGKSGTVDAFAESGEDAKTSTGKVTDSGTSEGNESGRFNKDGTETGTDSHTDVWTGYTGDKAKTLWDYNQYYINIYQMIIAEVAGFFMGVLG